MVIGKDNISGLEEKKTVCSGVKKIRLFNFGLHQLLD
jgi:hypothetical protein